MLYRFEATTDFFKASTKVDTLLKFAKQEGIRNNDENRNLFLKLGVVHLVTQFQVYVERVLEEYHYELRQLSILNKRLPIYLRLQGIKLQIDQSRILQSIVHPKDYTNSNLEHIKIIIEQLGSYIDDEAIVPDTLEIKKKYPLGKQGLNELKDLFKQIEGKDIFENAKFDIAKLNEILNRRHSIIHEDSNAQLTEVTLRSYIDFVAKVSKHIDKYLMKHLKEICK